MRSNGFVKYFFWLYVVSLFVLLGLALLKFRRGLYAEDLRNPGSLAIILGITIGLIGLPFLGSFFLGYRTRTRAVLQPARRPQSQLRGPVVEIPLSRLRDIMVRRLRLTYLAECGLALVIIGIFIHVFSPGIAAGSAKSATELRAVLLGMIGLLIAMILIVTYVSTSTVRKALRITRGKNLYLRMDESGLRVPVFLLANPAFFRSVEAGLDHLDINWKDIAGWSVEAAVGRAGPQFVLSVRGAAAEFGTGLLSAMPGGPRIGILRQPLQEQESQILSFAQQHASCPIRINDEAVHLP